MLPIKLVLKGFRGIKDGMNRDSYTLDLAEHRDSQLVALAGPNGRGKTTVLDNLQPYPILPSRANGYSLSAFSMYDHILAPEASKELIWAHAGKTYQTMCVWRIAGKRKLAEAFLFETTSDGLWQPVRTATGVVSDGKVDTYVSALTEILGPSDVYFSSVFAAQGRRKLFEYKEGEIKDLLAELLNLTPIQEKSLLAAKVVSGLKVAVEALSVSLLDIEGARSDLQSAHQAVNEAKQRQTEARTTVVVADKTSQEARLVHAARQALMDQSAHLEAQRAILTKRRDENLALMSERVEAKRVAAATIDQAIEQAQLQFRQSITRSAAHRTRVEVAIRQRDQLVAQRDAIRNAQGQVETFNNSIFEAEIQLKVATQRLEQQREASSIVKVLDANITAARNQYVSARAQLQQIAVKAELAETVPCVGSDLQPKCKLLIDAMTAKSAIEPATVALHRTEATGAALSAQKTTTAQQLAALGQVDETLLCAERVLSGLTTAKTEAEKLASMASQLAYAESELAAFREELAILARQEVGESEQHAIWLCEKSESRDKLVAEADPAYLRAIVAKDEAIEALAKLPTPADDGIEASKLHSLKMTEALNQAQSFVNTATSTLIFAEAKAAALQARIAQAARVIEHRERIRHELALWQLIAKGLGRDGLIAMLIDEAGPTLAALANDILLACYGRRFSLSIVTQKTRANGEMAETFDILVHDAESEEAKSLAVMSGGQKVWINEALTRAIALYCAQNAQRAYGALFCDEADGPLDPERKQAFFAMQREVLKLGGYEKAFFITQTPELVAQADAVINL